MTLHVKTNVLPGHKIEITAPALLEGEAVDVYLVPANSAPRCSMLDLVASLPPGPRLFKTWEEFEAHFQAERESWDR